MRQHIVNLDDDSFVMMHPITCRPNLFTCPFNTALLPEKRPTTYTGPGYYRCRMGEDNRLVILERIEEGNLPKSELEQLRDHARMLNLSSEAHDSYTRGFCNGLELALATLEDRSPVYKEEPGLIERSTNAPS